jgi:collagen type IX alpha
LSFFSSRIFNQGIPEQFSFVTTFRNNRDSRGGKWHLVRITDGRGNPQFAVGLDPKLKVVEFSILKFDRTVQTLSWEKQEVFSKEWHKIHFGVFR